MEHSLGYVLYWGKKNLSDKETVSISSGHDQSWNSRIESYSRWSAKYFVTRHPEMMP